METTLGADTETSTNHAPARTPLRGLRVVGTPLEQALDRAIADAGAGRLSVAAFSSSI